MICMRQVCQMPGTIRALGTDELCCSMMGLPDRSEGPQRPQFYYLLVMRSWTSHRLSLCLLRCKEDLSRPQIFF